MTAPTTLNEEKLTRLSAAKLAFFYALIAGLWIWLSGQLLWRFVADPVQLARWETYKGWLFVAVTALLLYLERAWSERKIQQMLARLQSQVQHRASELDRTRDQLQVILDHAPVIFYIRDLEGRYMLVNREWERYTGIPRSKALGQTPHQLFPNGTAERMMAAHRAVLESNKPIVEETVMPLQGAEHVFMRAHFKLNDRGGQAYAVGGILTDISERKAMEESLERQVAERTAALRQAVDDLAEAQRVAHVGSWSLDLASGRLEWSDETYRIFGVAPEQFEATRENFYAAVHPDDREMVRSKVASAMELHLPLDYEHRILRPDGSVCYVHERGIVTYDANGQPARLLGMVQDITERKLTDQALYAATERLATIVRASPAAIVAVDANWHITMWNPAAEQLFGWLADQVIGHSISAVFPAEDQATDELRARVAGGETLTNLELQRRRQDGTLIDVAASIAPLRDETGKVQGSVAVFSDITERKQAEAQIRDWNQQLEAQVAERTAHLEQEIAERERAQAEISALNQALAVQTEHLQTVNRELETFTYTVSHDLKAPLRGIDGYSRLLLEDYFDKLDEDGRFFLQTIRDATMQMAQLIDDLLAYSRLERRQLVTGQVDIDSLVKSLVEQVRHEQLYPQAEIVQETRCGHVTADADALTLALRNLLDNALKFSAKSDSPRVEIGGEAADDRCLLFVRDNGVGFDMQYHNRIFEIFQRLHRIEDYEGTGIGLAIVRKAIQRMGGRVWAESRPGHGATFYLEIPK